MPPNATRRSAIRCLYPVLAWVLGVLVVPTNGFSQPSSPQRNIIRGTSHTKIQSRIDLNLATSIAISNSPAIKQLHWQMERTKGRGIQASRLTNPTIGTQMNEIGNEGEGGQYGVYIQRNMVRNHRVSQIQHAFAWEANALKWQQQVEQRRVARKVAARFISAAIYRERIRLRKKRILEFGKIREFAKRLQKGGDIPEIQLLRLEIQGQKLERELESYQLEQQQQLKLLSVLLQSEVSADDLSFDLELNKQQILDMEFPEFDLGNHPQLQQIDDESEQKKWNVHLAHSRQNPDWILQSSVNFDTASDDFFAGFQLSIPWMVNDRKSGLIHAAHADLQMKTEERNVMQLKLEQQSESHRQSVKRLSKLLLNLEKKTIPIVDKNLAKTTKIFQSGEASYVELAAALDMAFDIREERLELISSLLIEHSKLETLVAE